MIVVTSFGQEMKASTAGGGEYSFKYPENSKIFGGFSVIWVIFASWQMWSQKQGFHTIVCCLKKMWHSLNQEFFFLYIPGRQTVELFTWQNLS